MNYKEKMKKMQEIVERLKARSIALDELVAEADRISNRLEAMQATRVEIMLAIEADEQALEELK